MDIGHWMLVDCKIFDYQNCDEQKNLFVEYIMTKFVFGH
jgi:hypothetical protein